MQLTSASDFKKLLVKKKIVISWNAALSTGDRGTQSVMQCRRAVSDHFNSLKEFAKVFW